MRAIYLPHADFVLGDFTIESPDSVHHLVNVVRVQKGESLLVLNGEGTSALASVAQIAKRTLALEVTKIEQHHRPHHIDLACAWVKREAMESVIKMAVELGVSNLFCLTTQYAQVYPLAMDRIERLVESALIQSNNPFAPKIHFPVTLSQLYQDQSYQKIFVCSVDDEKSLHSSLPWSGTGNPVAVLIGPEGGFSPEERTFFRTAPSTEFIHFPTPILRTPTAVATAFGHLFARLAHA